jgi:hypothetical protein
MLLPDTGVLFVATPAPDGKPGWYNTPHKSLDSAIQHVNHLTFEGKAAYYAMAGYDQPRYWDEHAKNKDGTTGRWRSRTQANARFIRSFFLDLDVDPADPAKFASKHEALGELRGFVQKIGLTKPMIVDSGGGIHAYWPLSMAIPTSEWLPVAEQFKAICIHEKFKADRSLTSDHARVLRALGSYNVRRGAAVQLLNPVKGPVSFTDFANRVATYAGAHGVAATSKGVSTGTAIAGAPAAGAWDGEDNLGASNDPLNFDRIAFHCAQIAQQAAVRGAGTGEQLWRAGLGIVKFCEKQELAARAISDGHADFDLARTTLKIENWSTGPTKCSHFHQLNPSVCEACPHHNTLTSPAQLGRIIAQAPAPTIALVVDTSEPPVTVTLPDPPTGYSRRSDGAVVRESEDSEGRPVYEVISPYDLYPLAIRSQNGVDANVDERSTWRVHLPLEKGQPPQARDFDVPLGLLADTRALAKLLFSKGIVLSGDQPKFCQMYMSAYLQKLAKEAGRDKLFERLGWHDDHTRFVLGDRVITAEGSTPHVACDAIKAATKNGLRSAGTLQGWQNAMKFYNRKGYEGPRFFMYASLASVIFHMNDTGNKGAVVSASGKSGRGKTTALKACSSLWGHPEALIVNGNKEGATTNALYNHLGIVHSLPFILDDTTERDTDEMRRLYLNVSQGEGKRRMHADGSMVGRIDTWANLTLTSTNADSITNTLASGKDVDPHLMRLIAVEFGEIDTGAQAKIEADHFIREMGKHYGHVGPVFVRYIVKHYEQVRALYIRNIEKVDRMLASANASAERYWSAIVAACYTAAQIASKAGLLDFPYEADLQWMISLLTRQRESIRESAVSPKELLTDFLGKHMRSTLIISAKASSTLDNVAHRPVEDLLVRIELDRDLIFISRSALMDFCATVRTPFKAFEWALEQAGIIIKRNHQKVLGADTIYSAGQTRCWMVNATNLGAGLAQAQQAQQPASNVVPISGAKTA